LFVACDGAPMMRRKTHNKKVPCDAPSLATMHFPEHIMDKHVDPSCTHEMFFCAWDSQHRRIRGCSAVRPTVASKTLTSAAVGGRTPRCPQSPNPTNGARFGERRRVLRLPRKGRTANRTRRERVATVRRAQKKNHSTETPPYTVKLMSSVVTESQRDLTARSCLR